MAHPYFFDPHASHLPTCFDLSTVSFASVGFVIVCVASASGARRGVYIEHTVEEDSLPEEGERSACFEL